MRRIFFTLFLLIVVLAVSVANGEKVKSLRGDAAIPAGSTPAVVGMDWQAADSAVARTFVHQPPLIPHDITGFEIEALKNDNDCLNCHGIPDSGTPMPHKSHYLDRDGKVTKRVSGLWYFCTQCHVGQVDAKPLVETTFQDK